jgi:hypothetical protein
MQKKRALFLIGLAAVIALLPAAALADGEQVGSSELIDHAADYDGKTVVYEGEAIGDVLPRGDYAWLAVSDGDNTIGCYVKASDAEKVSYLGKYGIKGDTVRIRGVFFRACAEHGGDLDIHADSLEILHAGASVPQESSDALRIAAYILPFPAAVMLAIALKRKL